MRYSDENSQTFLTADFTVTAADKKYTFQRCLSCYQTDREREEKAVGVDVANARLQVLYQELVRNSVNHTEVFF